jgi:mannosyltransferase OCH1-like enzyme
MIGGGELSDRPAIVQYWHEEVVPDDVREMSATFPEHNPDLRHLVFDESSAAELIAGHLGAAELDAFRTCAVPAMQADYFRYCAVYALGGVYCDADCRCIASLKPLLEDGGEIFEGPQQGHAHNEVFAFSAPGHPLLRLSIDIATTNIQHRVWDKVWMATGPWIFQELLGMWRSGSIERRLEWARLSPFFAGNARKLRYLDTLGETLGDDARIAAAFEGVRVSPISKARTFVTHRGTDLAYKRTEAHFPNFKRSIYR